MTVLSCKSIEIFISLFIIYNLSWIVHFSSLEKYVTIFQEHLCYLVNQSYHTYSKQDVHPKFHDWAHQFE